ncbi:hypothetical protein [Parerythrobacter aestuarii]|uniref:hypothetical protein n=1 Tax=Parerythrobacter aestuarii TaxID=3020909 RepID=UPI0024DE7BE0|nr:hypothetical protein [Parerythrobacter aestuarii]
MRTILIGGMAALALALVACDEDAEAYADEDSAVGLVDDEGDTEAEEDTDAEPGEAYDDSRYFVVLDGEGLGIVRRSDVAVTVLPFGTAADHVAATLAQSIGAPRGQESNDECGAGPMEFIDFGPLTINVQDDVFVGWWLRGDSDIATSDGTGIGTARAKVEALDGYELYEESTLGEEFTITDSNDGVVSGIFGDGDVQDLWAGTSCVFR